MEQSLPLVLVNSGEDSDFYYATRFLTHDPALYIRFGPVDDVLVLNILELERGKIADERQPAVIDGGEAVAQMNHEPGCAMRGKFAVRRVAHPVTAAIASASVVSTGMMSESAVDSMMSITAGFAPNISGVAVTTSPRSSV